MTAGIAANYISPHAGEIARTVLAGKHLRVPAAVLLATVVIAASLIYNLLTVAPALILGLSGLRRAGMILHRHLVS